MAQTLYSKNTNKSICWHQSRFFPIKKHSNTIYKHRAVIGIGGNVGDVKKRFSKLFRYLMNSKLLHVKKTSSILQNPPFGYLNQDDFFNAVMLIETSLSAQKLLKYFLHVEKIFGRKRSFKDAPRTLDLDIIFYNTAKIMQKDITIPHPHWQERLSVLLPLSTISEHLIFTTKGSTWRTYHYGKTYLKKIRNI